MKVISRIFFFIVIVLIIPTNVYGQNNQNTNGNLLINLRSIRVDLSTALFINDITILANIEFYKRKNSSVGIEPSINHTSAGEVGGSKHGSPYLDYNLQGYLILGIELPVSFKATFGYARRNSLAHYTMGFPETQLRYGFGIYWDFYKYFGLNIKYSSGINAVEYSTAAAGIGISFCWSQ